MQRPQRSLHCIVHTAVVPLCAVTKVVLSCAVTEVVLSLAVTRKPHCLIWTSVAKVGCAYRVLSRLPTPQILILRNGSRRPSWAQVTHQPRRFAADQHGLLLR